MSTVLEIQCDASHLCAAIDQLSQFAERFPERVQAFLKAAGCAPELPGFDPGFLVAVTTGQDGIALEPSNRLLHFLAAMRAGDVDCFSVE